MTQSSELHNEFLSRVISSNLLEEAKFFIMQNYLPDEIFDRETLEEWAENNGFTANEDFNN